MLTVYFMKCDYVACHILSSECGGTVDKVCQCAYWLRQWFYVNLVERSFY